MSDAHPDRRSGCSSRGPGLGAALLIGALLAPVAHAADAVPPPLAPSDAPAADTAHDARIEHLVTEDSQVRIEEERVRGQVQHIVVRPKLRGFGAYEIAPPADPSREPGSDPRAGKRIWLSLGF